MPGFQARAMPGRAEGLDDASRCLAEGSLAAELGLHPGAEVWAALKAAQIHACPV
ncbi:hypothetical protein GCM10027162_22400 [Streptomyces incanus]